jgi:outer membrane protein
VPGLPFRSSTRLLPLLLAGALGAATAQAQAQAQAQIHTPAASLPPPAIAFVVTERLFVETKAAKAADAAITAEFAGRAKANQALFVRLRNLTAQYLDDEQILDEPERTRRRRELRDLEQEAERKEVAYRDELVHRKNLERDRIAERARVAIAQIAREDNLDIVLFRGVLWARPGADITDKLIRQLDK